MSNKQMHWIRRGAAGAPIALLGAVSLLFCSCQAGPNQVAENGMPNSSMTTPPWGAPSMGSPMMASNMQPQGMPPQGMPPHGMLPNGMPGFGPLPYPQGPTPQGQVANQPAGNIMGGYPNQQVSYTQEEVPGQLISSRSSENRVPTMSANGIPFPANAIIQSNHVPRDPCLPGAMPTAHIPYQHLADGEYLIDGGDRNLKALIGNDWSVRGLDMEDTIAHYDTLDGDRRVEASNRVEIYAPRFGSVRKRYSLIQNQTYGSLGHVDNETGITIAADKSSAINAHQNLEPIKSLGRSGASVFKDRTRGLVVENPEPVAAFSNVFSAYESFSLIQFGQLDNSEKARLAEAIESAKVWDYKDSVQALVDNREAVVSRGVLKAQETVGLEEKESRPDLRIVKLASASAAKPGDEIEFTIRFDNIGNEKIGNVTILDNLTPRLEYIEGSAQCDLDFDFFTTENEGGSLLLRWEIKDPVDVEKGGVIRFRCIVR